MIDGITIVSTFPFLLHVLTAFVDVNYKDSDATDDIVGYWTASAINCYSLAPRNFHLSRYVNFVQATLAIVAFLAHASGRLYVRKIGYGILLALYSVTQLRLLIWGHGVEVIAYLFTHILIFSILVLYNDSLIDNLNVKTLKSS